MTKGEFCSIPSPAPAVSIPPRWDLHLDLTVPYGWPIFISVGERGDRQQLLQFGHEPDRAVTCMPAMSSRCTGIRTPHLVGELYVADQYPRGRPRDVVDRDRFFDVQRQHAVESIFERHQHLRSVDAQLGTHVHLSVVGRRSEQLPRIDHARRLESRPFFNWYRDYIAGIANSARLAPNQVLFADQSISSTNGQYTLRYRATATSSCIAGTASRCGTRTPGEPVRGWPSCKATATS